MADIRHQIELDVGAALECAEGATWVLEWTKEWRHSQELALSRSPPATLDDCVTWMRRARDHAEKLCRCFPTSEQPNGKPPRIAEWAERWPRDYAEF